MVNADSNVAEKAGASRGGYQPCDQFTANGYQVTEARTEERGWAEMASRRDEGLAINSKATVWPSVLRSGPGKTSGQSVRKFRSNLQMG